MPRIRNVGGVRQQPFFVPAVSNVATNGNGTGTKKFLKGTVRFSLSLVSSLPSSRRYYCSESKTIFYLDTFYCKCLLFINVEINPVKRQLAPKLTLLLRPCICDYDYWDS